MNKSIKIILLVVAILLAFGGIMVYYKTIVSPPGNLAFKNQYVNSDKNDISKVKSSNTVIALDSAFVAITHEMDFQLSNSLLTNKERDDLLDTFVSQYVPKFVDVCNNNFSNSVWKEEDLKKMQSRISGLKALTTTDRKVVIQGEDLASLNETHNVIAYYYEAKNTAAVSGYNGLQYAKQKIAAAKRYVSMSPINNCSALVNQLKSVSARLERAHYSYLVSQVERLRCFYNYNKNDFENLALSISNKLEEYKNNAKSTYGRASDVSSLESRAGEYYSNASFY